MAILIDDKPYLEELKATYVNEIFGMGEYNKNYPEIKDHLPRSAWKKLPQDLIRFLLAATSMNKPAEIADQHSATKSDGFKQDISCIDGELLEEVQAGNKDAKRLYSDIVKNQLYGILNTGQSGQFVKLVPTPDKRWNQLIFYSFKDGHIWDGGPGLKWIRTPYKRWIQTMAEAIQKEKGRVQGLVTKLNPAILKLSAAKLPKDLLQFALKALSERTFEKSQVVHADDKPNPTVKDLDHEHKWACNDLLEIDNEWRQMDINVRLANDKMLYMFYDMTNYRLMHTRWYSFKDRLIYRYSSYDGSDGFYHNNGKLIQPVPYKQWMQNPKLYERY